MRKRPYLVWLLAIAHLSGPHVTAEAQSVKAFEVASVRPSPPRGQGFSLSSRVAGTRFELLGVDPRVMIGRAFDMPVTRVVDLPDWATREQFDIRAVMPEGAGEQDAREMLKTLLADRFELKTHIEQRPFPVFELIAGPSGPRFAEVDAVDELQTDLAGEPGRSASDRTSPLPGGDVRSITRIDPDGRLRSITITGKMRYSEKRVEGDARQLDAERITMQEFSRLLSVERPVVDKTGLAGVYRFKTLLPPIPLSARMQALLGDRASAAPSIPLSRAVEELGLKLEPKNTPVDHIIVDWIERPTPN
jgi:uncharacterized protein (TIGR03435 family)